VIEGGGGQGKLPRRGGRETSPATRNKVVGREKRMCRIPEEWKGRPKKKGLLLIRKKDSEKGFTISAGSSYMNDRSLGVLLLDV